MGPRTKLKSICKLLSSMSYLLKIWGLESPKRLLWQTVKTQMKCPIRCISSGLHWSISRKINRIFFFKISICDPLKCIMEDPIFIAFICMEESIRIQRVNAYAIRYVRTMYCSIYFSRWTSYAAEDGILWTWNSFAFTWRVCLYSALVTV